MPPIRINAEERQRYFEEYRRYRQQVNRGVGLNDPLRERLRLLAWMLGAVPEREDREGAAFGGNNFAGPGWRDIAGARPTDLFDFASKLHDFMYEANGIQAARISRDVRERSRKSKADYIFRLMIREAGVIDEIDDLYLAAGAKLLFLGRNRALFCKHDGFVNIIHHPRLTVGSGHLMIPLSQLPSSQERSLRSGAPGVWPTAHDYTAVTDYDFEHQDWRAWACARFRGCWERVSHLSDKDGLAISLRSGRRGRSHRRITSRRRY